MLPFKWLFHFFSLLGCPANGLLDRSWGGEKKKQHKKALLLELADGLVLDSDNAFILLCQASSAAKNDQRGGKREGKIHISVTLSYSRHSLKFGYNSFLRAVIF